MSQRHVIVVGSGNAALCAGISALESGARVTMLEKADESEAGGNSRYTAGAMRFAYESREDILPLLKRPDDERLERTEFGAYPNTQFEADMLEFNGGEPLNLLQRYLIDESYATLRWLTTHNVRFDPIYSRQTFEKDGRLVFWGGLTLESVGEGVGLVDAQLAEFRRLGGQIRYRSACRKLIAEDRSVSGVEVDGRAGRQVLECDAVVLGCGGFEANAAMRHSFMGERWVRAKVRGTRHNTGDGLMMALEAGAALAGSGEGCHAVPMDRHMPDYGNLELPFIERKHYRKICYFLGVMLNANGERFVDEGRNFRNYTYAQFGRQSLSSQRALRGRSSTARSNHCCTKSIGLCMPRSSQPTRSNRWCVSSATLIRIRRSRQSTNSTPRSTSRDHSIPLRLTAVARAGSRSTRRTGQPHRYSAVSCLSRNVRNQFHVRGRSNRSVSRGTRRGRAAYPGALRLR